MPLTRRELLKSFGVAAVGFGMASAGYDRLIPYIHQPDDIVPGASMWFATSCRECPAGCGMLLRNRDSRVVKCEGNPKHPINAGKLCPRGQAALQGLYDPDRIKGPLRKDSSGRFRDADWDDALRVIGSILRGRPRIALMTDLEAGSLDSLMRSWVAALGGRMIVYEPINYEWVKSAFGGNVPSFRLDQSDHIVSIGADFLETYVSPVEYAVQFARMREVKGNRRGGFTYIGPRLSMTAANADEFIPVRPGEEMDAISRVRDRVGGAASPVVLPANTPWAVQAARALAAGGGAAVAPGRPHALTTTANSPDISSFMDALDGGDIDVLVVYRTNPAFSMVGFERAARKARHIISLSSFMDETTAMADWVLPSDTPLESWGDYRPYSDVLNILQPVMGRLYNTRLVGDILIQMASSAGMSIGGARDFYSYLRINWGAPLAAGASPGTSNPNWESQVQVGWKSGGTTAAPTTAATPATATAAPTSTPVSVPPAPRGEYKIWAFPHTYLYDGRGANKRWLQELPEPMTKATWGSWVEMHPSTARKLGVAYQDMVEITVGGESANLPAFIWNGVAPDTLAFPLGQGHAAYGRYAKGCGVNTWDVVSTSAPVSVKKGPSIALITRRHGSYDEHGRKIAMTTKLGERPEHEEIDWPLKSGYTHKDFYPGHDHARHRWAMVVDMNKCIGCHACVIACYAENNVAVVGAEQVRRRRDMQWLRIDPYIDWSRKTSPVVFQPMLCQHCDNAPCEPVCPVFAAAHSDDGLNMQVYNRCIGTRYCSNNCPYKVRRFNWYDWEWPEPLNWQLNPDVTVRSRGVMEKCTFCVQRIREVEIKARAEGRPIRDGEVIPACVQTCPTGVYTFGDLMDRDSQVYKLYQSEPRAYQVLQEPLNTKPGILYLKKIID